MKDDHFTSRIFTIAGALMCISGLLMAICVKVLYGGIMLAAAFCMFFAASNFRITEDEDDKTKKH